MKRRPLFLAFIVITPMLLFCLTGCSPSEETTTENEAAEAPEDTKAEEQSPPGIKGKIDKAKDVVDAANERTSTY